MNSINSRYLEEHHEAYAGQHELDGDQRHQDASSVVAKMSLSLLAQQHKGNYRPSPIPYPPFDNLADQARGLKLPYYSSRVAAAVGHSI